MCDQTKYSSNFPPFIFLIFLIFCTLSACREDACERLNCKNGGECIDGGCVCPDGFAGLECELSLDPCLQIECKNGKCETNSQGKARCICDGGFEGESCAQAWTEKFLGNYLITEVCNGSGIQYKMEISNGLKFSQVTLENFHNKRDATNSAKVVADLLNSRAFEIPGQYMHFGFVTGSGSINESATEVTFNFEVIKDGDTLSCTALMVRE